MTKEEKITRGKQILSEMQAVVDNYYAQYHKGIGTKKPEHFDYYCNILHAVSPYTYDKPIPIRKMYLALAEAEEQGKKVHIEPDKQFVPDEYGCIEEHRLDGWSYHIVID